MEKLLKRGEIKEIFEEKVGGRGIKKFTLQGKVEGDKGVVAALPTLDFPVSRRLLELAVWIKLQPEGWGGSDDVKKAKQLLKYNFIPKVEVSREDPDKYAFAWPIPEVVAGHGGLVSRFF